MDLRRIGSIVVVGIALAGVAVSIVGAQREWEAKHWVVVRGAFFRGVDSNDATLYAQNNGTFPLERRAKLLLGAPAPDDVTLERLTFRGFLEDDGTFLDVLMRHDEHGDEFLRFGAPSGFGVMIGARDADGGVTATARFDQDTPWRTPGTAATADVEWKGGNVSISIDGRVVIENPCAAPLLRDVTFSTRGGTVTLDSLGVAGTSASGAFAAATGFDDLPVSAPHAWLMLIGGWLVLFLIVAAVLRAVSLTRMSLVELVVAACAACAPASLCAMVGTILPAQTSFPFIPATFGFIGLFVVGRVLALRGAEPAPASRGLRIAAALAVVVALGFALRGIGTRVFTQEHALARAEEVAAQGPVGADFTAPARRTLDAGNAAIATGEYRDFDLHVTLTPEPGAIAEIRLRASNPAWPEGVALFLSSDPRFSGGFRIEEPGEFLTSGERVAPLVVGSPADVRIVVRGREFRAELGGREIARAETPLFPAGAVVVLASRGRVAVEALEVKSVASPAAVSSSRVAALAVACACGGFLTLVLALAASIALSARVAFSRGLVLAALSTVVLASALSSADDAERAMDSRSVAACAAVGTAVALLLPVSHSRRLRILPFFALLLLVGIGIVGVVRITHAPLWPPDSKKIAAMSVTHWSGDRLDDDLLWLEHPLFRRWNVYLADHDLRGREHTAAKPPGVKRVLCVGTSSTYGAEADSPYPLRLERMLVAESRAVEVLNGGLRGATGDRVFRFLRDQLVEFAPDVVTVSLFYNDSFSQSQSDEESYLTSVTAPGATRSLFADARYDVALTRNADKTRDVFARFAEHADSAVLAPLGAAPPERFAATLERFVLLAKERGFRLVFIEEPLRGDEPRPWKAEFRAAMTAVGRAHDVPVVDPTPALLAADGATMFADQVHPRDAGHEVIARQLLPVLRGVIDDLDHR